MKALSLIQPWATLVVLGIKTIETRNWATPYRGPIFIHASKSRAGEGILQSASLTHLLPPFDTLPLGAIIGEVTLKEIVRCEALALTPEQWEQRSAEGKAFGEYAGKFCWMLEDAIALDQPIPATGRLGLWEF